MGNIYYNSVLYFVLSSILLCLWINEKKLGGIIKKKRNKFSNYLIKKMKIENKILQKILKTLIDWIETLGSAIFLVLLIQHFYLGNFLVPTGSMIPTINPKDRLFGDMISYKFVKPKRGDILVFIEPIQNKLRYTKRLVGMPGEKIRVSYDKRLYIDGEYLEGEKFERDYYQLEEDSALKDKEWRIPKKGDKIKLISGEFKVGREDINFKQLTKDLNSDKMSLDDILDLRIKTLNFEIDGKKYKEGLWSYIVDINLKKRLLKGETIEINGRKIKIIGGKFALFPQSLNLLELKEKIKENPNFLKDEIEVEKMKTLINSKDESGPILDREVLKQLINGDEVTLENDYYFVMGDNSKNSLDSRFWGFVKDKRIKGRPFLKFWPINKLSFLK